MTTTTMTKEEMIDKLVEHDVDNFDIRDLANLFRYGMTGYEGMSDEELKDQYEFFIEEDEDDDE
jgi:hypothetical protein